MYLKLDSALDINPIHPEGNKSERINIANCYGGSLLS